MLRRLLATGLLLTGASVVAAAVAAESSPPVLPTVAEPVRNPVAKEASTPRRIAAKRKSDETPKTPRQATKPPLRQLEEKNLGLGCAQP